MKQEINPKTAFIIIAVLAVVVLGIGYKIFFSAPAAPPLPAETPQNKQFMHPLGPDSMPAGASGQTASPGQTGQ
jgi:hypothetical protein